ncbi:MAG: GNAT family N-acetyltransferase [Fimbriimonadaceae bacterium]|nr:GNAT family N-acetyltransferase [Fimbriimonadaceae bacterium]
MALNIRPFEPSPDLSGLSRLSALDPLDVGRTEEEWSDLLQRFPPAAAAEIWTAESAEGPTAFLILMRSVWEVRDGGWTARLHIDPDSPAGTLKGLWSFLHRRARTLGAGFLNLSIRADMQTRRDFLTKLGMVPVRRHAVSRIDLEDFRPGPWEPRIETVSRQGIRLATFRELADEGVDWATLQEQALEAVLAQEYRFGQGVRLPFEKYLRRLQTRSVHPETGFGALLDGRMVGFSRLHPAGIEPGLLRTGLTGVVQEHRGRRIGTALKAYSLSRLKEDGWKAVQTDNPEDTSILHLNLKLGFERRSTVVEMAQTLQALPAEA